MGLTKLNVAGPEVVTEEYKKLQKLLEELENRELPEEVLVRINDKVEKLDSFSGTGKKQKTAIAKTKTAIFQLLERELKLVPKKYYLNLWMVVGMSCFGVPLGMVLSASTDNYGMIGIGLPIGMGIGMAMGASMDKKAKEEGRQLEV